MGELVQIDGSPYAWFEDRAPVCSLLVFIDDATGRLLELLFTEAESTFSYFEAAENYFRCAGKPLAFYSDKLGVFVLSANMLNSPGGGGRIRWATVRATPRLDADGHCRIR